MKLKDNKIYCYIMIPLCIAMCLFGRFIPTSFGLSSDAWGVIFIFLGTIILWLTISIDWPSILCIFSLGFIDSLGFNKVLSSSFGNATFVFLLFTFVCSYALSKTDFIKRVALLFINNKLAKKNGYLFISLFLLSILVIGLFTSPTVLFVVVLPILKEIIELANIEKDSKLAKVLILGLGFTVSISSGMTPIAHVFPVLAMNAANIEVSLLSYMAFAIPTGLLTFIIMLLIFLFIIRPDVSKLKDLDLTEKINSLNKMDRKEIISLVIFAVVILLWILPSIFRPLSEDFYNAINKYGTAMPPLLGTIALCIIRVDNKPIISLNETFKNGIPWSSLVMCIGTLALGAALTDDKVGIKTFLSESLGPSLSYLPSIVLLIIFVVWAAIQTNLSSNMVTASLVSSIASSILLATNSTLNLPAVICLIGMMSAFAFATPPSMPHIAIIASSESCNTKDILIYGGLTMIAGIIITLCIGYPIAMLVM